MDRMEIDELKAVWAAHGAALERSLVINERLLREMMVRKARRTLAPWLVWRCVEVVLGAMAVFVAAPVLIAHIGELRYVVAAGAATAFLVGMTALAAHQLVVGLTLDDAGAVTAIRRDVERLKLAEYRALVWALLGGIVVWLPVLLVLFEAITGVDALARVDLVWLIANLVFGAGAMAAGLVWSRKNVGRGELGTRAQRIVDALSGRSLRAAISHLDELAQFRRDEPHVR
jgi:hypothetical protein